jgi:hypothetical protein
VDVPTIIAKTSKTRLTGSRKTRARRRATRPGLEWLDALEEHCVRLDMMSELLLTCGEPLADEVVRRVGLWMNQEVRALQALREELGKETR